MTREEILNIIQSLAQSQGFYGRLLQQIQENPEDADRFFDVIEEQHFREPVDFILWMES